MEIVTTTPLWRVPVHVSRVNPRAHSESRDAIASAHRSGRPLRARASKSRVTDGQTFLHKSARRARTACVSVRAHEGDALIERRSRRGDPMHRPSQNSKIGTVTPTRGRDITVRQGSTERIPHPGLVTLTGSFVVGNSLHSLQI